jgi:hypothetical protein
MKVWEHIPDKELTAVELKHLNHKIYNYQAAYADH